MGSMCLCWKIGENFESVYLNKLKSKALKIFDMLQFQFLKLRAIRDGKW